MPLSLAKFLAGQAAAAARSSFLRQTRRYGSSTSSSSSHYQSTTIMLPLMKLGTLAIRTISKPIAARLKTHAAVHPRFRAAIIWMAQTKYRWATQLQRRVQYGRAINVAIRPLDEAKAIAAATDFLGELVIFTVAGLAIVYEVNRSYKSEAKKEAQRKKELEALKLKDRDLEKEVESLRLKLQEMEKQLQRRSSWLDYLRLSLLFRQAAEQQKTA
ncbi:OPA3-like protein [Rosa chinensis]|uniref:OPA3-like protein n=1 Tax=Rosa chinensis TaxID=74649 RepID=UPI001AD930C2|nr:OPA3-like protein [Rosa chinensis]